MNNDFLFYADIWKSASDTDMDLLNCLLLIRYLCAAEVGQACDSALTRCDCEALWHMIVEESYKKDGEMLPVIKHAIDQASFYLPFAPDLSSYSKNPASVDENTLRVLVQHLTFLPADRNTLITLFEYIQKAVCDSSCSSGDFRTPRQIVQWMTELLEIDRGGSVYDPCCGSGAMLCGAALSCPGKKLDLYGQSLDPKSLSICKMNLFLQGLSANLGQHSANTLLEDIHPGHRFDYILTNPPFNSSDWCEHYSAYENTRWQYGYPPRKNANFAWLQHILGHLAPTGQAVALMPNGTLTTQNLAERDIRKQILDDGWVEAILALPPGLFSGTRIPCCAWVISRDICRDTVLLVDARHLDFFKQRDREKTIDILRRFREDNQLKTTEWYAAVHIREIMQMGGVLSPNLYTRQQKLSILPLQQLSDDFIAAADTLCARISSPTLCKSIQKWKTADLPRNWEELYLTDIYTITGGAVARKESLGQGIPMADVKTVIRHMFLPKDLTAHVQLSEKDAGKYDLRTGDILLNRTSETVDELACCSAVLEDRAAIYSAYLKRLRPHDANQLDPRYAAAYFRSRIYRQEIQRVSFVYTTRANMNLQQLSRVRLYCPSASWQQALGETLYDVVRFGQEHQDRELEAAISRFVEVFIEKFITYPISLFQKERDQG